MPPGGMAATAGQFGGPANTTQSCSCLPAGAAGAVAVHGAVNATRNTSVHWEEWENFDERNWFLLVAILVEVGLVLGLYWIHIAWNRRQEEYSRSGGLAKQSEAYAQSIVKYFLPSIHVQKHRFKGIKRKTEPISVAFEDMGLKLHNGATVLAGVTGEFPEGRLCAVMGPSGAGKTTFMNVLCGKATYGTMTGKVLINGEPGSISDYKSVMGFVPQDDIVHENLTVSEQISFSAQLRGPPDMSSRRCRNITEDVLQVMQIDHIRNSIVGSVQNRGISGGQRKRVNIGLELAADPTILFLDEPTSGLDSTSSLTIVNSLKRLTSLGMTAIMVIHQPRYSLFTLFDDVLLLGKGGRTVYLGPSLGAKPYFEHTGFDMPKDENPADWFMDVISGEVPNNKVTKFVPQMLFDMWENRDYNPDQAEVRRRSWTAQDDRASLTKALEEEWNNIDVDKNGVMDEHELSMLLMRCEGTKPDEEVVETLFENMADPDEDVVTKRDFLEYLVSLQDVVMRQHHYRSDSSESDESGDSDAVSLRLSRSKSFDLHRRHRRGFRAQFKTLMCRRLIQWWRSNQERVIFLGVIAFAAVILGVMDRVICKEPLWAAAPYLNLHTALALLTSVYCLATFGGDQPMFWRESASGVNVLAFFLARVLVNFVDLTLQCFLFSATYYFVRQSRLDFGDYFAPFFLVSFAASGVGYFISAVLPPAHGPFVAALVSFVSCGLLGHPLRVLQMEDGSYLEALMDLTSITRWSVGMAFLKNLELNPQRQLSPERQMELEVLKETYERKPLMQETFGYWGTSIAFLSGMGVVLYVATFLGLRCLNRDKQV